MYQLSLDFEQILQLVKQLPYEEKKLLSEELGKESISKELMQILEEFKTDEISVETINEEVEAVREEIYGIPKKS